MSNNAQQLGEPPTGWRLRLYNIIFESDTRAGRLFDFWLIVVILLSVLVVVPDSLPGLPTHFQTLFDRLEWLFTALFTLEYLVLCG